MPAAIVTATEQVIADDAELADDVVIEAESVHIGPGSRIGFSGDDAFRTPGGVRIRVRSLILGARVTVAGAVAVRGGDIALGSGASVGRGTTIEVADRLAVGDGGVIGEENDIRGRDIEIGQELWTGPRARIGGGSAFEATSRLRAGHYLHLGLDAFINTARPVEIGHEVGLGTRTSIYTHGAYSSGLQGFPVSFDGVAIGDFSWLPGATVNPGVRIGRNCVIGVNSLVTSDIPDGALAAGSPARVIREGAYPRPLAGEKLREFASAFLHRYAVLAEVDARPAPAGSGVSLLSDDLVVHIGPAEGSLALGGSDTRVAVVGDGWARRELAPQWTAFDTADRRVIGIADAPAIRLANELRRHGIRFYSRPIGTSWQSWEPVVPHH